MARVNLEERFFSDKRAKKLSVLMGWDEKYTRWTLVELWHGSQEDLAVMADASDIVCWADIPLGCEEKFLDSLEKSGYVTRKDDKFIIHGNEVQIESRVNKIRNSFKGGEATRRKWEALRRAREEERNKEEQKNNKDAANNDKKTEPETSQEQLGDNDANSYPQDGKSDAESYPQGNVDDGMSDNLGCGKLEDGGPTGLPTGQPTGMPNGRPNARPNARPNSIQCSSIQDNSPSIKMDGKTRARDEPENCDEFASGQDIDDFLAGKPMPDKKAEPNKPPIKNKNFDGVEGVEKYAIVSKAKTIEILFHDPKKGRNQFVDFAALNSGIERFFAAGRSDADWSEFRSWLARLRSGGMTLFLGRFDKYVESWSTLRKNKPSESAGNNPVIDGSGGGGSSVLEKKIEPQKRDLGISRERLKSEVLADLCGLNWAKKNARPTCNNVKEEGPAYLI